jgi:hypothetical protein
MNNISIGGGWVSEMLTVGCQQRTNLERDQKQCGAFIDQKSSIQSHI